MQKKYVSLSDKLDEKLLFIWENIVVLDYCKKIRKINGMKINMDEDDLYEMLLDGSKLKDTEYYKDYNKVMIIINDDSLLGLNNETKYQEKTVMVGQVFPLIISLTDHINNLVLNKFNETLYTNPQKGIDILYKEGDLYNEDTFTVIDELVDTSDRTQKIQLYLYLLNLKSHIKNNSDKKKNNELIKKLSIM